METTTNIRSINKTTIIILVVLVLAVAVFALFQTGVLGGNSCGYLLRQYNKWAAVENYGKVSEFYGKLEQKGCEF